MLKYANIIYKEMPLNYYCKLNNINYKNIAQRLRYCLKHSLYINLCMEQKIDLIIEKYYKKEAIKYYKSNLEMLQNNNFNDFLLCKNLNLNYDKLKLQVNDQINMKKLIIMSWFSSNKVSKNGSYITLERIEEIKNDINTDINDLIALYKIGMTDSLKNFLNFEENYLKGIIKKITKKYNIYLNKFDYEDIFSEAQLILIQTIDKIVCNKCGQIINYIYISVYKKLLDYLIKNHFNKAVSYNDNIKNYKINEMMEGV